MRSVVRSFLKERQAATPRVPQTFLKPINSPSFPADEPHMKTRALVVAALLVGLIAFQASRSGRLIRSIRESAGALDLDARQALAKRAVYPFSLVPGGTLTPAELRFRPDKYARQFYGDLDYKTAQPWRSYGETHYNSYRIGNRIYQKTTLSRTHVSELLIKVQRYSGEVVFIRARCGNLLLDSITQPVQSNSDQPDDVVLGSAAEKPQPPGFSPALLLAYAPHFNLAAFGDDPASVPKPTPPLAETLPATVAPSETLLSSGNFAGGSDGNGGPAGLPSTRNLTSPPTPNVPVPEPGSLAPPLVLFLLCFGLLGQRKHPFTAKQNNS